MLQANTPGERDGRVAFWVDGKLVGDFPELRLRDVPELKINAIIITLFISNNDVRTSRMWYDDLIAATSYIGPVFTPPVKPRKSKLVPPAGWGE